MIKTALEMFRGDTVRIDLTVTQDGVTQDITGWTFWMTAKTDAGLPDEDAFFQLTSPTDIVITDAALGTARITIPASTTSGVASRATLLFDVQGRDMGGGIHTLANGTLKISPDVTRAI